MIEYRKGRPGEMEDLRDFANYVFSQAHRPHDFSVLLEKVYGLDKHTEELHYLAIEDGKVRGMVCAYPHDYRIGDTTLNTRFIGTVSTHPYYRSHGYMKGFMKELRADMEKMGVDLAMLGGQRQRYQYFGYEVGGMEASFSVSKTNLRHVLGEFDNPFSLLPVEAEDEAVLDQLYAYYCKRPIQGRTREEFYEVLRTWDSLIYAVLQDTTIVGYMVTSQNGKFVSEFELESEEMILPVLQAHMNQHDAASLDIPVGMYETAKIRILEPVCEGMEVTQNEQMLILNYPKVLKAFLELKKSAVSLADGVLVLGITGEGRYRIEVRSGEITVTETAETADLEYDPMEAVRMLTTTKAYAMPYPCQVPSGWFPLFFNQSSLDCF